MNNISVVIPTCDRPAMLLEAVNCVLGQSLAAFEIIVVNNGNHPLEKGLLPEKTDLIELPPYVGVSIARNQGVSRAKGEYVAFLDDDDFWEVDYLKKLEQVIFETHPDCIITRLDEMTEGQVSTYKNPEGRISIDSLLVENPGIVGSTTIVRREPFLTISGYDPALRTSEDKALIMEFMTRSFKVIAAPHVQAIMRRHASDRLQDADSMVKGIQGFLTKYSHLMTPAQRNYNLLKITFYRYLSHQDSRMYIAFWCRYGLHWIHRIVHPSLPVSPRLSILHPRRVSFKN